MRRRFELVGCIASAGFGAEPGVRHRITIGAWEAGPLGPMADVMWAKPSGERVLLADSEATAAFVSAVYAFDRLEVVPFALRRTRRTLDVAAGPLRVSLRAGAPWALPPLWLRPPVVTKLVEAPIVRRLLGVHAWGTSPTGVDEWYRATQVRLLRSASASAVVDGVDVDLGPLGPVDPPLGVGFSEPPRFPSMVLVQPLLEDPSARLDRVLDRWTTGVAAASAGPQVGAPVPVRA